MSSPIASAVCAVTLIGVVSAPILNAAEPPPVTVTDGDTYTLDNGLVSLGVSKTKPEVAWVKYERDGKEINVGAPRAAFYYDCNGEAKVMPPDAKVLPAGYHHPVGAAKLVSHDDQMAGVSITEEATPVFPFRTDVHYLLRRGDSGFYGYVVVSHDQGMPAGAIDQNRIVFRGPPGTTLFTDHVVDDQRKGPFPTAKVVKDLQDATWELADGTSYTKYNNSIYVGEHHVHGMVGHGIGAWIITPSNEYMNGGPVKQELSVHMDNVMIATFGSAHFGSTVIEVGDNEKWSKFFGPCFVYFNASSSVDYGFADAKRQAQEEINKWPYQWVKNSDYPIERGSVTGQLKLTDGASTEGAWVVLAAPDKPWQMQSNGYEFWGRADATGHFTIPKVRPGKYTLYASGADQFEDFHQDGITVTAGQSMDLREVKWEPIKHGQRLWQIGRVDHSSGEFKNGDDSRHWGMFLRYGKDFPNDVDFTIGKSNERTDWNFAQWTWYSKKPYWTIHFDAKAPRTGKATLTVGAAAANPMGHSPTHGGASGERATNLEVKVNGAKVGVLDFVKSGPAAYRSGNQDNLYQVKTIEFAASLLKSGANAITLGDPTSKPIPSLEDQKKGHVGCVMYDAIRLEVAPR